MRQRLILSQRKPLQLLRDGRRHCDGNGVPPQVAFCSSEPTTASRQCKEVDRGWGEARSDAATLTARISRCALSAALGHARRYRSTRCGCQIASTIDVRHKCVRGAFSSGSEHHPSKTCCGRAGRVFGGGAGRLDRIGQPATLATLPRRARPHPQLTPCALDARMLQVSGARRTRSDGRHGRTGRHIFAPRAWADRVIRALHPANAAAQGVRPRLHPAAGGMRSRRGRPVALARICQQRARRARAAPRPWSVDLILDQKGRRKNSKRSPHPVPPHERDAPRRQASQP